MAPLQFASRLGARNTAGWIFTAAHRSAIAPFESRLHGPINHLPDSNTEEEAPRCQGREEAVGAATRSVGSGSQNGEEDQ